MLTNLTLAAAAALIGSGPSASNAPTAPTAPVTAAAPAPAAGAALADKATAVSLSTEDDLFVKATYFPPKARSKQSPAALLLHDKGKTREELEETAEYLYKRGFAVMTIDLRGHGESETEDVSFEDASDEDKKTMWSLSSRDIEAAAAYLADQDGVHATNLSIVGIGSSASLAVRRALKDENVRAIVLVDPELETFEYDVVEGVTELGGLPTMVLSSTDGRKEAKKLQDDAHEANGGLEYVEVKTLKCEKKELLAEKRFPSTMAAWLRDQAMPRK